MTTLYLDTRNLQLSSHDGCLRMSFPGADQARSLPLSALQHVVVASEASLSARMLAALGEHEIALTILSPRHNRNAVALIGRPHADIELRMAQYRASQESKQAARVACTAIAFKRAAQLRAIRTFLRTRRDCRRELIRALRELRSIKPDAGDELSTLRGKEGAMARAHYAAMRSVLPSALGFETRQRRPPPDPVNTVLSLAYTLLHGRAVHAAWSCGLDPMLGFLHAPARGRDSLACDLAEPLRPAIDVMVWRLFAEKHYQTTIPPEGSNALAKSPTG